MTVTASIVPSLTRRQLLDLAVWQAAQERSQAEYARHRASVDDLAVEYPCARCRQGEHGECRGNSGPARRHRCLCWEMWHPTPEQSEET